MVDDSDLDQRLRQLFSKVEHDCQGVRTFVETAYQCDSQYVKQEAVAFLSSVVDAGPLSDDAEFLLKDVFRQPFCPLADRYERIGNEFRGFQAKDELLEQNFVLEQRVGVEAVKRKLLEPTEKARSYLAEQGFPVTISGDGGIRHRFWQAVAVDVFRDQVARVEREREDADVWLMTAPDEQGESEKVAVEIAMQPKQREVDHVQRRLLEQGFDGVFVVCPTQQGAAMLEQRLQENELLDDNVTILAAADLF